MRNFYLSIKKYSHDEKDIFQKAIFLTQAYKNNLKESDVDISYSINKFFSHVLGLKGEVPAIFGDYLESLEGSSIDRSLIDIIYMLKKFEQITLNDKYQPHLKEVTQAVCEAFCVKSANDKALHTIIHTRLLENKAVVIIPARSTKHVFGITLIKKDEDTYYVSHSNRGLGTTFNGSLVFKINQTMADQIIQTFTNIFEAEDRAQEQCNGIFLTSSQTMFQPHPIENVNGQYEFYFKFQKPEYLASLLMQIERSTADPSAQQKSEP